MHSPDRGRGDFFIPLSLNRYIYGMNDPINHVDEDGNDPNNCHTSGGVTTCEGITPPPPITVGSMILGSWRSPFPALIAEAAERDFENRIEKEKSKAYKKLDRPNKGCEELFQAIGVDPQTVLAVLLGSNYEDGTKSGALISDLMGKDWAAAHQMSDWTVAALFRYGPAPSPSMGRVNGFSPPGGTIYVRPTAVSWSLMAHEALHQFAGLDDETVMARLAAKYGEDVNAGGIDLSGPSGQITKKINEKCN
jgi:hypothetical protein